MRLQPNGRRWVHNMSGAEPSCFRCNAASSTRADAPWAWSEPRALCPSHKVDLELEDGQRLEAVVHRVEPPDSPLEGSLIGWIFNPVFAKTGADQKRVAWTDFAGGGMAVFEDRFSARSYFEFRAFEVPRAVDLLYALRSVSTTRTEWTSTSELLAAVAAEERAMPHPGHGPLRGAVEGWGDLVRVWNFQLQLSRIRGARGRLWPESFAELFDWIKECGSDAWEPLPGTEASFRRELDALVLRRFPATSRAK